MRHLLLRLAGGALLLTAAGAASGQATAPGTSCVRVTLATDAPELTGEPVSGRLLVFAAAARPQREGAPLRPQADPEAVWIAAADLPVLRPGESVLVDVDRLAFPRPLSQFPAGEQYLMALVDVGEDFGYFGFQEGDVLTNVTPVTRPATCTAPAELLITRRVPRREFRDTAGVLAFEVPSARLSAFWGRPVTVRATVVLPDSGTPQRVVYHVPGWGGSHLNGYARGRREAGEMRAAGERAALHVYLDPAFTFGHHAFTNSDVNGPWGDALVREFIPALEARFGLEPQPHRRHLLGHSSGGWAVLSLQIAYPDVFGGAWATAPDPVDFQHFFHGAGVAPGSRDNLYRTASGEPVPAMRGDGPERSSLRDAARLEAVLSPYAGQLASFEAVFGPRGADGRARPLFDRATGEQDAAVQAAWSRHDLVAVLESRWPDLDGRLRGRLHVTVGGDDQFYLDGPVARLCALLQRLQAGGTCEIIPGRGHFDLYAPSPADPDGLLARFAREMQADYDRATARAADRQGPRTGGGAGRS